MASESVDVGAATLHTGATMPLIGLGTWQSAPGEVENAVFDAIEVGYRHIDGAAMYKNETEVGVGLRRAIDAGIVARGDVFVTSKLWPGGCHPHLVAGCLTKTLSELGTDYLDLWLVHWPQFLREGTAMPPTEEDKLGYSHESFLAVWREMEKEVAAGRVRHIGVSNMSNKKLHALLAACSVKPAVNQVESHPNLAQTKLIDFCTANGVVVTAYSPLGSPGRPDRVRADFDPHPMSDERVTAIAAELECTPAQVLIAWQIKRGVVVIPKSVKKARIVENFNSKDVVPRLTDAHMASIAEMDLQFKDVEGHGRLLKRSMWHKAEDTYDFIWEDDWVPPS